MGHREVISFRHLEAEYDIPEYVAEKLNKGLATAYFRQNDKALDHIPETGWGILTLVKLYFWFEETLWEVHYLPFYGDALLFRKAPIQMFPYVILRLTPRSVSIFGEGLGRLLLELEQELTELHNIRLDNHKLTNMPIFKVRKGSSANQVSHFRPGMKVPVETPADIDVLLMPQQLGQGIMEEERQLIEYAKLISGISELMAGQPPSPYHTAYAVEASLLEGSVRFKLMFHFSREALRYDALYDLLLMHKYSDPLYEQRLTEKLPPILEFTEEEIIQESEFVIEPNTANINKETDRQRWLMIRQLFMDRLSEAGRWEVDAHILRLMGLVNPESILGQKPDDSLPAPVMEEQIMAGVPMGGNRNTLPPELIEFAAQLVSKSPEAVSMTGQSNIQQKELMRALGDALGAK